MFIIIGVGTRFDSFDKESSEFESDTEKEPFLSLISLKAPNYKAFSFSLNSLLDSL